MLIALFYKFRPFFLTHALSNMDAKFGLQSRIQSLFPTTVKICPWRITKPKKYCSPYVHAFLNRQLNASIRSPSPESPTTGPSGNVYVDNWYDRLAINHLSQSLQAATGVRTSKNGYDGLVEVAAVAYRKFNPNQQRDVVIQSLEKAFPRPILTLIRTILPQSKFAREYFALFTTIFFAWLIGPCEVRESEFDGRKEKNVVHIKKCRFLEGTNCVGMCTSLCKMPSQIFIKDSLGMPLNMVPNFEDMSCEMIFGQQPPLPKDDPAFTQPCYIQCKENKRHSKNCPSQ